MWTTRLPGARRLHGLHPGADGRWLAVGGLVADWVRVAGWAAPGPARPSELSFCGPSYSVTPDLGRVVMASAVAGGLSRAELTPDGQTPWQHWTDRRRGDVRLLAVAVSPDGRTLAVADQHSYPRRLGATQAVVFRDLDTWAELARSDYLGLPYGGLVWRPDGKAVAAFAGTAGICGDVTEFAPTGRVVRRYGFPNMIPAVEAVAYSPCGRRLAALDGFTAWLFRRGEGRPVPLHPGGKRKLGAVAFAPDGRLLTAGGDGVVRTWDADAGTELGSFAPGVGPLHALAVAPDGLTAAAGGAGGRIAVWDL
jgi:WD40 repeat protein